MSTRKTLRRLAETHRGVLVPGAFNALSARVVEDLGFEAIYVTGAGITNMWFGMRTRVSWGYTRSPSTSAMRSRCR